MRRARCRLLSDAPASLPLARSTMTAQEIEYSEKYFDDEFEYRCSALHPRRTHALCRLTHATEDELHTS